MGYRHRFAYVGKGVIDAVRDMSVEELKAYLATNNPEGYDKDEDYFCPYALLGQTEFFDFGKNCNFAADLIVRAAPLFSNPQTQGATDGFVVCSKDDFKFVIEEYRKLIYNYFKECERRSYMLMQAHFHSKVETWGNFSEEVLNFENMTPEEAAKIDEIYRPYNLSEESDTIVRSWDYEYEIFELVRLYKTFDWENRALLFYGW